MKTGVEFYATQLFRGLQKVDTEHDYLVYTPSASDPEFSNLAPHWKLRVIPMKYLWSQIRLALQLTRDKPDFLFVPAAAMPFLTTTPVVTAIHDVAFWHFPESYSPFSRWYLDIATRVAVKRAIHIVTISHSTKHDLIRLYDADPEKISVIYLGFETGIEKKFLDNRTWSNISEKFGITKPYFVTVGRVERKKNVAQLVKAFYQVLSAGHDMQLVIAGKSGHGYEEIKAIIDHYNIADRVVVTGYVTEEEKRYLMHYAKAFVFVPIAEGFGIPILEAFAAGLPVVASDIPVFRELYEGGVFFAKPRDTEMIAQQMMLVIDRPERNREMQLRRREIMQMFTWDQCTRGTYDLFKEVITALKERHQP